MARIPDPLAIVRAFDAACNAHDLETVLSLFADDAVVRQSPPSDGVGIYRGKEQIGSWFQTQLPGFHVDSSDHRMSGDSVSWSAMMTDDLLRQIGQRQPLRTEAEAVVRDGKIASLSVTNPSLLSGS